MKALLKIHSNIIEEMQLHFASLPNEAKYAEKTAPNAWSRKEIIGHLIDSALNNHRRFLLAVDQKKLVFAGYQQVDWVLRNGYQNRPINELFQTLVLLNQEFYFLVKGMDFAFLTRKTRSHNFNEIGMNPIKKGEPSSLSYLFWDYLFHLEHHLIQVFPDYIRQLKPKSNYKCI
jgi:hypothetical protein